MKRTRILCVLAGLSLAASAHAQSGQGYTIVKGTIGSGGGVSELDPLFRLVGTIALPGANPDISQGGDYRVQGGLWPDKLTVTAVEDLPDAPTAFRLFANEPNPFNPLTRIRYELPRAAFVRIEIHDLRGAHVRTLFHGQLPAGRHSVQWNGRDDRGATVASGVYSLSVRAGEFVANRKMSLIK